MGIFDKLRNSKKCVKCTFCGAVYSVDELKESNSVLGNNYFRCPTCNNRFDSPPEDIPIDKYNTDRELREFIHTTIVPEQRVFPGKLRGDHGSNILYTCPVAQVVAEEIRQEFKQYKIDIEVKKVKDIQPLIQSRKSYDMFASEHGGVPVLEMRVTLPKGFSAFDFDRILGLFYNRGLEQFNSFTPVEVEGGKTFVAYSFFGTPRSMPARQTGGRLDVRDIDVFHKDVSPYYRLKEKIQRGGSNMQKSDLKMAVDNERNLSKKEKDELYNLIYNQNFDTLIPNYPQGVKSTDGICKLCGSPLVREPGGHIGCSNAACRDSIYSKSKSRPQILFGKPMWADSKASDSSKNKLRKAVKDLHNDVEYQLSQLKRYSSDGVDEEEFYQKRLSLLKSAKYYCDSAGIKLEHGDKLSIEQAQEFYDKSLEYYNASKNLMDDLEVKLEILWKDIEILLNESKRYYKSSTDYRDIYKKRIDLLDKAKSLCVEAFAVRKGSRTDDSSLKAHKYYTDAFVLYREAKHMAADVDSYHNIKAGVFVDDSIVADSKEKNKIKEDIEAYEKQVEENEKYMEEYTKQREKLIEDQNKLYAKWNKTKTDNSISPEVRKERIEYFERRDKNIKQNVSNLDKTMDHVEKDITRDRQEFESHKQKLANLGTGVTSKQVANDIEHFINIGHSADSALKRSMKKHDLNDDQMGEFKDFAYKHEQHRDNEGHPKWGRVPGMGFLKGLGRQHNANSIEKLMDVFEKLESEKRELEEKQTSETITNVERERLQTIQNDIADVEGRIAIFEEHPELLERGKKHLSNGISKTHNGLNAAKDWAVNGAIDGYHKHKVWVAGKISTFCAFLILVILYYMKVL
ncbi:MAG: hypothetical protein ACTSYG_01370, partial [Candidatus Heimdallarchaeota archaeon]